jgi:putative phage-type endonuclease
MPFTENKSVQTCDEDFAELSDTSSSDSSSNGSDDYSFFLNEKECIELCHTINELIEEYIKDNILSISKPHFMTELTDDIAHIIFQHLTDADILRESNYDSLYMFISDKCDEWFLSRVELKCPIRHLPHHKDNILVTEFSQDEEFTIQYITDKLYEIRNKDEANSEQRTAEWYLRRYNMLTASNVWQALGTDAQYNRLIYEKCKPLETSFVENKWISTQGSLHWGVKYEPLTVIVYEHFTGAKISNFGCIQHSKYPFLGASPDGIVTNIESPLYGRLVEIKNIFNREMNGIPNEAYWIQTQLQMQCCDLEACDFVETRFKEYETFESFLEDSDEDKLRGIILEFVPRDSLSNIPLYKYSSVC